MKRILNHTALQLAGFLIDQVNRRAYKTQTFKGVNERPLEYVFALECLSDICPQKVLDIGSGLSPWPAIMAKCGFVVTAVDEMKSYWKGGIFNQHFYVIHDDITQPSIQEKFDFITCISTLEHISDHCSAVRSIFNLLNPNGYTVLTIPFNDKHYIDNVYRLPGAGCGQSAPYICQVFSSKEIDTWLEGNSGRIVKQEFYEIFTGDFWTFGERIYPPKKVNRVDKHHLTAILIQKD
ncbi:MAG: methyltransferase domain-containing protein [candidate division Zixibacteria bacterium]|nr:methyltransferase domain-containing protein [candidate division Zixibacteria bacterium]